MGIAAFTFATAWGIKATFKVVKNINNYKEQTKMDKLTAKEVLKIAWRPYLPVVIAYAIAVPCTIVSNKVVNKKYAALATAYTISEAALQEYQDKTREIIGEKKAKEIQESVNADKVQKTYTGSNQIIITDKGESLFFEPISGRYFKSNWNDISKAANDLNADAIASITGHITLNDWFSALGLEESDIGEEIGWSLIDGSNSLIDIEISSHLTKDNIPCGAISYRKHPIKLNDSLY